MGQKNTPNFGEDLFFLFFLEITWFSLNIASIQFKTNENSGQVRLRLNETSKKAPLPLRNPGYATDRTTTTVLCFFSPSFRLRLRHCQLYFKPKNKGTTTCLQLANDYM